MIVSRFSMYNCGILGQTRVYAKMIIKFFIIYNSIHCCLFLLLQKVKSTSAHHICVLFKIFKFSKSYDHVTIRSTCYWLYFEWTCDMSSSGHWSWVSGVEVIKHSSSRPKHHLYLCHPSLPDLHTSVTDLYTGLVLLREICLINTSQRKAS
jgi:hypothetical protein